MKKIYIAITAFIVILFNPVLAFSVTIRIEAENFTAYNDIAYKRISPAPGPGCSGGTMLIGLDYPDEWTEYSITVGAFGTYSVVMLCRGDIGERYRLSLKLTPQGDSINQVIAFSFTGNGYG